MNEQPPKPPLEDPLHEKEIFASEVAVVGMIHENIAVTLAQLRFDEPVGNQMPKVRRIVAARLMLTSAAAGQLLQQLQRLAAQIEACGRVPKIVS
jgi:hypothetical protein